MAQDGRPGHLSRAVWVAAAAGAIAIHAGCVALALGSMQRDDSDRDLGAPAIEIGVELLSPQTDPSDVPVGPDAEASAASPAVVEQKKAIEQTELPKAESTQTDDPDRIVSPIDPNKPKDEDQKTAKAQTDPSEQSLPSLATAAPAVDGAAKSNRSTAPALGTGHSARLEQVTWEKQLAEHFDKYKRYPPDRTRQSATVIVNFVLDRTGHVLSMRVIKSSGDAAFDDAALAMLRRSDPVPPPPELVADQGLTFTMPVVFFVKPHK